MRHIRQQLLAVAPDWLPRVERGSKTSSLNAANVADSAP
jgi:hypothetical protein